MTTKDENNVALLPLEQAAQKFPNRRKLLTGSTAGVGVFLAVQARTALGAGTCQSISAQISGAQSPRPGDGTACSGGRSPGFWKQPQHFSEWGASGLTPPTFGVPVQECMTGLGNLSPCDISNRDSMSKIKDTFLGAPGGHLGIWEVLAWPTSYPNVTINGTSCKPKKGGGTTNPFGKQGQLLRHLSAALLNAYYFNSIGQNYVLTPEQVIDIWNQLNSKGSYCPSGISCSPTSRWSAAQIIAFIEGLYDFNASVENDLCKA